MEDLLSTSVTRRSSQDEKARVARTEGAAAPAPGVGRRVYTPCPRGRKAVNSCCIAQKTEWGGLAEEREMLLLSHPII